MCVKIYVIWWRFTLVAKSLRGSLFFWTQCTSFLIAHRCSSVKPHQRRSYAFCSLVFPPTFPLPHPWEFSRLFRPFFSLSPFFSFRYLPHHLLHSLISRNSGVIVTGKKSYFTCAFLCIWYSTVFLKYLRPKLQI